MADRQDVERAVKETLRQFLGEKAPPLIRPVDKPISGLGLTSMDGIDFACELQKKLGCIIPEKVNPFVDDSGHVERTVQQIVDVVYGFARAREAAKR